jgi:multimeric flavodoxin WrbA
MKLYILGVNGTPVKGETNTGALLQETMDAAVLAAKQTNDQLETEIIKLADLKINGGCNHCNWCLLKQTADQVCSKKDDMEKIYPKIVKADGIIYATPVYIGRLSWLLAAFIDRQRALGEGRYYGLRGPFGASSLQDKVIGAAAVAWMRHGGIETAQLSLFFMTGIFDQIFTTGPFAMGASGCSASPLGQELGVKQDVYGMGTARTLGRRVFERARIVKAGKVALRDFPAYLK